MAVREKVSAREVRARVRGPLSGTDPRVVASVRATYLNPPSTLPYNLSTDPLYLKVKHAWGWHAIHKQLTTLFRHQPPGFFVEAGALDGEKLSNTLWLEQHHGWTGLLLEPNPVSFQALLWKQRKAWASGTCLSTQAFPVQTVLVGLLRRKLPEPRLQRALNDHRGSSYLLGVSLDSHIYDSLFQDSEESYHVVQCFPLVSYLLALDVSTVDLLSLDVQGAEKDILRHVPWDSITIRVLVVEVVYHETLDQTFVEHMTGRGYVLVFFQGEDYIFVRQGDPVLANVEMAVINIFGG